MCNYVKITICLTDKMHCIAEWIFAHNNQNLSQLARNAFSDENLIRNVSPHSLKAFGTGHFRTTLLFTPEMDRRIDRIAKRKNMSRSAVVRAVLYPHMQTFDPRKKQQKEAA